MNTNHKPSAPLPEEEQHPVIVRVADATIRDANTLLHSSGGMVFGRGMIGTVLALVLGFLCPQFTLALASDPSPLRSAWLGKRAAGRKVVRDTRAVRGKSAA